MKWIHRNIEIEVNQSGKFNFKCCDTEYSVNSLDEAKEIIDDKTESYYFIDKEFYLNMRNKLDDREVMFLDQLIEELSCHQFNAYCQLGIRNWLEFNISADVFKICKDERWKKKINC